jgi:hypothetical protein
MDSFDVATARTPSVVPGVRITLHVIDEHLDPTWEPGEGETEDDRPVVPTEYRGGYHFEILDEEGDVFAVRQGNLTPHLTNPQKTQIVAFLDAMLAKAQGTLP